MSRSKSIVTAVGLLMTAISSAFAAKKSSDLLEKHRNRKLECEENNIDEKLKKEGK